MPTSSEIIQRRSLFAAQGTRRYKRSGCIGIGDRFTSESVIGIPRIAHSDKLLGKGRCLGGQYVTITVVYAALERTFR